jgi:uncharacterized protein (DUF433 family)
MSSATAETDIIGLGMYTLQEAARYGQVSTQKLSRWVWGTRQFEPVIEPQLKEQGLVSFYDLIQAKAVDVARAEGIPLRKIRQAIETARERYQVKLPLARKHKLLWYDRELHIQLNGIFQVSGKTRHQMSMKKIIEPYAKDLHFDEQGLAYMWTPFRRFGRRIIIDPNRQFGQPLVEGTGYRADVLATAFQAEGSLESAAEAYNLDVTDIKVAVAYMTYVRQAA